MRFTGYNILYLPQATSMSYTLDNVLVDSYTYCAVNTRVLTPDNNYSIKSSDTVLFSLNSGYIYSNSGAKCGTYNTGEPFSLSGWIDTSIGNLLMVNGVNVYSSAFSGASGNLGAFIINMGTGNLYADVTLNQTPINPSFTVTDFLAGSGTSGILTSDKDYLVFAGNTFLYQSYENLLNSGPIVVCVPDNEPVSLAFTDGDNSFQNNQLYGYFQWNNLSDPIKLNFFANRTINTGNAVWSLLDYNDDTRSFGSQFNGLWSGNTFVYQDSPSVLTWSYTLNKTDAYGIPMDKLISASGGVFAPTGIEAAYITGFQLTSSGEYLYPPDARFTGYYYVTGLDQSVGSMLFSSGCTGNLTVTFKPMGFGAGASGYLVTYPMVIKDLYQTGLVTYYLVDHYQAVSNGTGYSVAPMAIVNTGQYGSTCYDVPTKYGYNIAWFSPFNADGTMDPSAAYLTGVPLLTTGIVGGSQTGFIVTGLDVWNIGSGYRSGIFQPYVAFVRQSGDNLTKNASGTFLMASRGARTQATYSQATQIEIAIGTRPWTTGAVSFVSMDKTETTVNVRLTVTGLDITVPITAFTTFYGYDASGQATSAVQSSGQATFAHYFDSGTNALKKNYSLNTGTIYPDGSYMTFLMTQDELDNLYSSSSFTNNSQGLDLGDLNF